MWGNDEYIKERMSEITNFFFHFYRNIVVLAAAVATDGDLNHSLFNVRTCCRVATIFSRRFIFFSY